jgi:hypothetical protein
VNTMQTITVMYKRSGRSRFRARWHLLDKDGEPVCRVRFALDDWAIAQTTYEASGAGICPRCKAIWRNQK